MTFQRTPCYVGLATSMHDPALAIVNQQGDVVFAEGVERAQQTKRGYNSPAAQFCALPKLLEEHAPDATEIVVASTWQKRWLRSVQTLLKPLLLLRWWRTRQRGYEFSSFNNSPRWARLEHLRWAVHSLANATFQAELNISEAAVAADLGRNCQGRPNVPVGLSGKRLRFTDFDHHLTHAAVGCYGSPFETAACAILDTSGQWGSAAFYSYQAGRLTRIAAPTSWGSLGQYYSLLCYACGFDPIEGEEWKVMGLAATATASPTLVEKLRRLFAVRGLQLVRGEDRRPIPAVLGEFSAVPKAELAASGQQVYEQLLFELLDNLHAATGLADLVLGGGCALNSSANGKILDRTPFQRLHIASAPADDGNALGAAWLACQADHPQWRPRPQVLTPYLGSNMSSEAVGRLIQLGGIARQRRCGEGIASEAAKLLSQGKIIAWVQGRAEFGPRSLGNRSILADPRDPSIKDRINARVKFREEFRPFAPTILHDFGPVFFEDYQETPYMERTLRFREHVRELVPATVHVDGTGRLQTVKREWNPRFFDLIEQFRQLTGIPLVLNTSLNIMGKPIAHSVEDVVGLFYTTGLDAMIIDELVIEKS